MYTLFYCQTRFQQFRIKVTVRDDTLHKDRLYHLQNQIREWKLFMYGRRGNVYDSCEVIAEFIRKKLVSLKYIVHSVEVSEDGENGAIVLC